MKSILLHHADRYLGSQVSVSGWITNLRSSGKIIFIQFRDGSGEAQVVLVKSELGEKLFAQVKSLTIESAVKIEGLLKKEPRSPSGYEISAQKLEVIQISQEYPIGKKAHGISFLLDHRHLWLRSPRQRAIQTVRNQIIYALYDFYQAEGFIKIDTPIITPNACEGTTTLFAIDYFGKQAYLSQSGQLYLEAAIYSVGRCFDFAPVFRAEKSKTRRHLTEFWMTNAEMAFIDHEQNLAIQEKLILHVLKSVLKNCQPQLAVLERNLEPLMSIKAPFIRLTYREAKAQVKTMGSQTPSGADFGNEDETLLMNHYHQPVFVEHFPAKVKAFYMKRHPKDNELALCADLLSPEGYGEVIGGSQREDDYDRLLASVKAHRLPAKDFQWYLDLRRFGSVPHSGFGLGLERLVTWFCGLKHVRESIPFPRTIHRLQP